MQPSDIAAGRTYRAATGPTRKVYKLRDGRVYYREACHWAMKSTTLKQFAAWAREDVTKAPAVNLARTK